jgi:EAL domain-containing protein (putative c-di-GMP-specific phosphodiesterase class I)
VLGQHVLTVALDDLARWGGNSLTVGVNMSPRELGDPALAATIVRMLDRRGLARHQLSLEVTEQALVDDIEPVVETIAALREAGVSVAVDDFGTGYSSLRYLRRFDANIVKIDREFVQAASTEPRTDALVRSVVSMAAALDLVCVAEGIETLEQLALVRAQMERSERTISESIALQKVAVARQSQIRNLALPLVGLLICLLVWLLVRWRMLF